MRIAASAAAVLAALTLAACSSTTNGSPTAARSSSSSVTTPTSPAPSTSSTGFPSSSSSSTATGGLTEAQAQAALLTAAEVGGGFAASPPDESDSPLPCTPNEPTLDDQFPPDVTVEADFGGVSGQALISEQIEAYADTDTVAQVIAAGEQGLACSTATVSGVDVAIQGPTDLTSEIQLPLDKAEGWALTSSEINTAIVIAQLGQHLVVFSFGAAPSVDTSQLPDPPTVITSGLEKVLAALP